MSSSKTGLSFKSIVGFIIGPILFVFIVLFVDLEPGKPEVTYTLAIAFLMAVWWITEIIPLSVTALLPVVLFPAFGVMNGKDVSSTYFNYVIFLFAGGFLVALAMERWNLHKRIALKILLFTGTSPLWLLFGFMMASAFLSMWISNTATVMMMLPIILSIISQLEEYIGKKEIGGFSTAILLGVAYGASIGGIATLVGTPPNPILVQIMVIMFPESPDISFFDWFLYALPITVSMFVFVWLFLFFLFKPKIKWQTLGRGTFRAQYSALGKMGFEEKIVLIDFIILAVLWLTRSGLKIGTTDIPGWGHLFKHPEYLNDGTVAIAMSLLLFLIPSRSKKGKRIMNWKAINKLPWGILLLFGGGFALASGFKVSGLSEWFGYQLASVAGQPHIVMIIAVALGMTFLTELTSNTATTQLILPILAGLAVSLHVHPLLLMLPATISASMAFMLPVATPPNAIVFSSHKISIGVMARTGFIINIVGAIIITLITYYWGTVVFGFETGDLPVWALPVTN
jgi:solute carrier family 13 (sodium-dependent dicarboxylate transporter), member 2/3/5